MAAQIGAPAAAIRAHAEQDAELKTALPTGAR